MSEIMRGRAHDSEESKKWEKLNSNKRAIGQAHRCIKWSAMLTNTGEKHQHVIPETGVAVQNGLQKRQKQQ